MNKLTSCVNSNMDEQFNLTLEVAKRLSEIPLITIAMVLQEAERIQISKEAELNMDGK